MLTVELETLKAELERARKEVQQQEAAAAAAEKARATEKVAGERHQARVREVEETLKGMFEARDKLQAEGRQTKEELEKLQLAHSELKTTARADREVLQQVEQIASGKIFLLQCVFGSRGCVELTQLWRSAEVFEDLPRSAEDAVAYFGQLAGHEAEKAFWGQFPGSPSAQLLNHQVK